MQNNQTALITGGAVRLGRAIALSLAEVGYDIALHYRGSQEAAEATAAEIRALGVRCELYQADLLETVQARSLVERVMVEQPGLSVLVNGASIYRPADLRSTEPESFDAHLAIHLRAPFFLLQSFARLVRQGSVINIVDTKVTSNQYDYAAYLLSKKALGELTRMAALELAPGIRVNGISPGVVLPPAERSAEYVEYRRQQLPLQRLGSPEDITRTVRFLLESPFITGQIVAVDGGESINWRGESVFTFAES